jgi:hypothetical protein
MVRRSFSALLVATCLTLGGAGSALAGSLPSANSGTISVYVPGSVGAANAQPTYHGLVAFNTTGTGKLKNPRAWISCYQNGALVYGAGGSPTEVFKLGGDSSLWVRNGGGAANCTVQLYYILNAKGTAEWTGNGAQGGNVVLANSAFNAAP